MTRRIVAVAALAGLATTSAPETTVAQPTTTTEATAPARTGPARYVDPRHAAAEDAGSGSATQPYRTLTYAMKQLRSGETLVVSGGVYRESLIIPDNSSGLAVQAAPGADVIIKGSDVVTGWQRVQTGRFVKRPWTANTQQVFVDGLSLQQIGGQIFSDDPWIWPGRVSGGVDQLTNNSFYYDAGTQSLYIQVPFDSVDGRIVEASVRNYVAFGQGLANVTLRDLRFQHSNTTSVNYAGAVTLLGNRLVVERIEVTRADGNGFDISGDDNVVRDSRANYCGQVGMKVRGQRNRVTGNETNYNNRRGFNKWWEAGGAKFTGEGGLRDSEVSNHRAIGNDGDGIWFDWMNRNNRIFRNVSAYNSGFGIHYEASQAAYLYDNYVFGNGQRGIYLAHSGNSVVAYNLVVMNGLEGIVAIDEGRNPELDELRPRNNRVFDNIVGWNGKSALVLPAGRQGNTADFNLYLGTSAPSFSLGWPAAESPLRNGLDEWRSASGQDMRSWYESTNIPAAINDSLAAKDSNIDWTPVLSMAPWFSAPVVTDLSLMQLVESNRTRPGPQ